MKKTFLNLMIAGTLAWGFSSCGNNPDASDDSVDTAEKMNDQMAENKTSSVSEDDAEFAVMAADAGMTEVELGKVALAKSTNANVKKYAQMMVDDHTAANNKLLSIASAKMITLPSAISDEHKKHIDDMSNMSGKEFDKAYIDMMVNDHNKVVDAFKKENETTQDAELKSFTAETLPVLTKHYEEAKSLQDKMK